MTQRFLFDLELFEGKENFRWKGIFYSGPCVVIKSNEKKSSLLCLALSLMEMESGSQWQQAERRGGWVGG